MKWTKYHYHVLMIKDLFKMMRFIVIMKKEKIVIMEKDCDKKKEIKKDCDKTSY